jgi:hypothetical protein
MGQEEEQEGREGGRVCVCASGSPACSSGTSSLPVAAFAAGGTCCFPAVLGFFAGRPAKKRMHATRLRPTGTCRLSYCGTARGMAARATSCKK